MYAQASCHLPSPHPLKVNGMNLTLILSVHLCIHKAHLSTPLTSLWVTLLCHSEKHGLMGQCGLLAVRL
jgi:hypothetical protein